MASQSVIDGQGAERTVKGGPAGRGGRGEEPLLANFNLAKLCRFFFFLLKCPLC